MNPAVTLINLLAIAPAILGRTVGLQVSGIPVALGWPTPAFAPLIGYMVLIAGLCLLLLMAGLRLFRECVPEE